MVEFPGSNECMPPKVLSSATDYGSSADRNGSSFHSTVQYDDNPSNLNGADVSTPPGPVELTDIQDPYLAVQRLLCKSGYSPDM